MCTYFTTKTDVAQNLIDHFFSNFDCQRNFPLEGFLVKKNMGVRGSFLKKAEALYAELNERAEAATSSYSVTGDFLQYTYSVPVTVTKNHKNIRCKCLVHEFSLTDIF